MRVTFSVVGSAGADVLEGTATDENIFGGNGEDSIAGLSGNDFIRSGGGADLVLGNGGNDTIWAGTGKDTVFGGRGDDSIEGGAGADLLAGDFGSDSLEGGTGDDTFYFNARTAGTDGSGGTSLDVITDFTFGDALLFGDFDPAATLVITQDGANVLVSIDIDGDTIGDIDVVSVLNSLAADVSAASSFGTPVV